jgi:hypothetical protein
MTHTGYMLSAVHNLDLANAYAQNGNIKSAIECAATAISNLELKQNRRDALFAKARGRK